MKKVGNIFPITICIKIPSESLPNFISTSNWQGQQLDPLFRVSKLDICKSETFDFIGYVYIQAYNLFL